LQRPHMTKRPFMGLSGCAFVDGGRLQCQAASLFSLAGRGRLDERDVLSGLNKKPRRLIAGIGWHGDDLETRAKPL
jgi:hypothetical protein